MTDARCGDCGGFTEGGSIIIHKEGCPSGTGIRHDPPDQPERQYLVWSEAARRWDLVTTSDLRRLVTAAVVRGHALPRWIFVLVRDPYTSPRRVDGQVSWTSPTGNELIYSLRGAGTAVHEEFVVRIDQS